MKTTANFLFIFLCFLTVGLKSQNAPVTTAGIVTNATTAPGAVVVPITIKNFVSIGSFTLTLRYKANLVTYVSVTPHPSFTGMNVSNTVVGNLGKIIISWPQTPGGITLPDETHLLDLTFTYLSGTSILNWFYTSGNVCQYYKYSNGSYILLNDSPKSSYYINGGISNRGAPITYVPVINNPVPGNLAVPVTANNFTAISAMTLTLEYNQAVLNFQGCTPNPGLLGTFSSGIMVGPNGKMLLTISWYGLASLANGSTVVTINFIYSNISGSYSSLDWFENGPSCQYADVMANALLDSPTADYYHNGAIFTQIAPRVWLPVKTNEVPSGALSLPLFVNDFNNVRSFTLSFEYDPAVMTYGSFAPDTAFGSALIVSDSPSGSKRKIVMSWSNTVSKTLPEGSLIATLNFTYNSGTSLLTWMINDETSCRFNDANGNAYFDVPKETYYQDGMVASHVAPQTAAWNVTATTGQQVTVPINVFNFSNIGLFSFTLDYDPAILSYQSVSLVASIGGSFISSTQGLGRIIMDWSGTTISLADSSDLINLTFIFNGGESPLAWFDDGISCRYAESTAGPSLYDQPRSFYYINGYVGLNPLVADFMASAGSGGNDTTIVLTDLTTGGPMTWNWTISPSTYYFVNGTSESSQNPQVRFTSDDVYSVTLIVTRGMSSAIKIKTDYLYIGVPTPPVVFTCGTDVTVPACQTQATVDDAYAAFIASTTASGGCEGILTNNAPATAPSICGGFVDVTWTYTSTCEPFITSCTRRFTVAATAVDLSCPPDYIMEFGQPQEVVDSSYSAWLDSATVSGGCNTILINDGTGAPSTYGGSVSVTWTAISSCQGDVTCTSTFTVTNAPSGLWTGITSSDWFVGSNWYNFQVPSNTTDVVIPDSAPNWPHLTGNLTVGTLCENITMEGAAQLYIDGDFTINAGSSLTFTGSGTLFLGGSWSDSGVFNTGTSTVEFTGPNDASILEGASPESFYKVVVSKTNAILSIQGIVNVIGTENQ